SNVIRDQTDNGLFILTYFWGIVAANLFITRKRKPWINRTIGSIIVIGIALLIAIFNVEGLVRTYFSEHEYAFSRYGLSMGLGLIIGVIFWRQKHPVIK
ncbi:MAG: hypothetical protein HKO90_05825, partial [Flavobacteriaceae bacterium]|nr:hypothetical protein [Flavobacteriaceae bacterium]